MNVNKNILIERVLMAKKTNFKLFFISLLIAGIVAGIGSFFSKISFFVAFGIAIVAMIVNAIIMDKEDNEPGGLNNPKK